MKKKVENTKLSCTASIFFLFINSQYIIFLYPLNYSFKTRPGDRPNPRPGFRVLTGSPDRLGQFLFLKSKRRHFSKKTKKIKVNEFATGSCRGPPTESRRFFLSLFFLQPGPVPVLDRPPRRAGFQNHALTFKMNAK